jgi:Ca2+-binding EF-hand superfamily protein
MGTSVSKASSSTGFEKWEVGLLERMFHDLSTRSHGKKIDKTTFMQIFKLPGMMGERLFDVLDQDKSGKINFDEFLKAMKIYSRGTFEEKMSLFFDMYDLTGDAYIHKDELKLMLYSLMTPVHSVMDSDLSLKDSEEYAVQVESIVQKTVDDAFGSCDPSKSGKLTRDQFKEWLLDNPAIMEVLCLDNGSGLFDLEIGKLVDCQQLGLCASDA